MEGERDAALRRAAEAEIASQDAAELAAEAVERAEEVDRAADWAELARSTAEAQAAALLAQAPAQVRAMEEVRLAGAAAPRQTLPGFLYLADRVRKAIARDVRS